MKYITVDLNMDKHRILFEAEDDVTKEDVEETVYDWLEENWFNLPFDIAYEVEDDD